MNSSVEHRVFSLKFRTRFADAVDGDAFDLVKPTRVKVECGCASVEFAKKGVKKGVRFIFLSTKT